MRCSSWATRSSSSSHSSRVTRPSSRSTPLAVAPAFSPTRMASPRQRIVASSIPRRTSSRLIPPFAASVSASSSARSAVSATAPTSASKSRLTGSSMRPCAPSLPTPLSLRRDTGCAAVAAVAAVHGRDRREVLHRLRGGRLFRLLEGLLEAALRHRHVLAARELGLALLPDRQQRRGDEDGRVSTGRDPDHQREREVLQRRATEEEEREHGQ